MRKVLTRSVGTVSMVLLIFSVLSCSKKQAVSSSELEEPEIEEIQSNAKNHVWYCFTETGFQVVDLPQNAPEVLEKPWTESVRISSAAPIPLKTVSGPYDAFAIVNRLGVLAFNNGVPELFSDNSIFATDTADSIVFSGGVPVFYLYRSTFFNDKTQSQLSTIHQSRPFLVEFEPNAKICYPLVSYGNLNLLETDQISGFFWNGSKWACSVKSQVEQGVEFSYFCWEPLMELTDLSPALNKDVFVFSSSSEAEYRGLNLPHLYQDSPKLLKSLLSQIPEQFPLYVSWRDASGTSPVSYFQEGNGTKPINACAFLAPASDYSSAVFEDGTTYIQKVKTQERFAFRLPRLPASYSYTEAAISGDSLIVSWEQKNFYKTGKSGFIVVDLKGLLK